MFRGRFGASASVLSILTRVPEIMSKLIFFPLTNIITSINRASRSPDDDIAYTHTQTHTPIKSGSCCQMLYNLFAGCYNRVHEPKINGATCACGRSAATKYHSSSAHRSTWPYNSSRRRWLARLTNYVTADANAAALSRKHFDNFSSRTA